MTESAHSSTNYYKQSKGFKDWDSVAVESGARRHLGASNMLDNETELYQIDEENLTWKSTRL